VLAPVIQRGRPRMALWERRATRVRPSCARSATGPNGWLSQMPSWAMVAARLCGPALWVAASADREIFYGPAGKPVRWSTRLTLLRSRVVCRGFTVVSGAKALSKAQGQRSSSRREGRERPAAAGRDGGTMALLYTTLALRGMM
jgi:hypothetical protein